MGVYSARRRGTLRCPQQHPQENGIGFLKRLLGGGQDNSAEIQENQETQSEPAAATPAESPVVAPDKPASPPIATRQAAAACPYCATLLDPAPERGRLCPRCRRRIVVRRVGGRIVLLTEQALDVFEGERDRESREAAWTGERRRWLALAKGVSAPANRVTRLAAAQPSEAIVSASKSLYLTAAERAVRTARRDKRWVEVARVRHDQAAALYRAEGSPIPPPDEIVALHREWSMAALRADARFGVQVELVAGGCCPTCGHDNGRAFRISAELKEQRLPHPGCPKGLCLCDWYPLPGEAPRARRARRRAAKEPG